MKPAVAAVATICAGEAAAADRRPQTRSIATAATASRRPCRADGRVGTSDIVSTPPGRRTRNASRKNRSREGKWNAASTLITPSNEPSANGSRHASAHTAWAPASRRRPRPASSWDHVMFTAVSDRGRDDLRDHRVLGGEPVADVEDVATGRAAPPRSARRAGGRRPAPPRDRSPSPSHSPRFNHPGASARKKSGPIES